MPQVNRHEWHSRYTHVEIESVEDSERKGYVTLNLKQGNILFSIMSEFSEDARQMVFGWQESGQLADFTALIDFDPQSINPPELAGIIRKP